MNNFDSNRLDDLEKNIFNKFDNLERDLLIKAIESLKKSVELLTDGLREADKRIYQLELELEKIKKL